MGSVIKWNALSGTILYIVNVIIAFFMSPFLLHSLGNRDYGLWDVMLGIIGYMGLLDLGMGPALVRYVAVAEADKNYSRLNILFSSAFFFFLFVGVAVLGILSLLSHYPALVLGPQIHEVSSIRWVFLIVGVNLLLQFPGTVFVGTLMGLQRHYLINSVRAFLTVGQALLMVALMKKYPAYGLVILASIETFGLVVQYSLFCLLFMTSRDLPKPSIQEFSLKTVREMWWFGVKNSILMLASRLQKQTIPLVIGRVLGLQTVVFFSLPNRLVEYGRGLSMSMGFPLMPYFGVLLQSKDVADIQHNWKKTSYALQVVTLGMVVFLWFSGEPFLRIWIGPEYAENGRWVLRFLIMGLVVEAVSPNAGRLLIGAAKHGKAAKILLIISVLFIPCAIAGAYLANVAGVAAASAVASSCGAFVMLFLACRQLGITVKEHLRDTVAPLVLPLTVTAFCLWIIFKAWPPLSYGIIFSGSLAALCLYLVMVILMLKYYRNQTPV
ncbi:MAG: hypothetical protein WCO53_05010 [Deltaproteobacteria bacterium]